ncbi:hypothetical protein M406DRAFT_355424 [Cryphonectria parasitica EP155]|uniref:F-box domain-containing protein n=1 Tax=Cryphonectria parasitica (strain ATCC 38755 / EP155) TaxID=660469 RepID=A0A9P5CRD6_CRYP1|nr:uncharacterized protein M406DRAFT_355424 [Cryphonectria parasitica EP155]KAF3766985.1 hypothetical protein M406DRAFT_355424 [Cryphonectria parasitica EP155]
MAAIFPWDGRDQQDQAEARYNAPLRSHNRQLEDENMRLKRLLREHGIPWSDAVASHPGFQSSAAISGRRRSSRLSALDHTSLRLPHLPVEVILRIMQFALLAQEPIIDPLCRLTMEHLTAAELRRAPQTAIGFLATCKTYHFEGTRIFWSRNTFTFTSPEALRRFADLQPQFRNDIRHINLRIVAHYYDDEKRTHRIGADYHPDLNKSQSLKVAYRPRDPASMSRTGFRSYAWTQTVDFLDALRPPYDPDWNKHNSSGIRPRLLPGLLSMRMDFVNFPDYFLPLPDTALHELAAHDLGSILNELMVTGLPCCEVGAKAGGDLQGMVKDDGLFLCHAPSYVQQRRYLKPLRGYAGLSRVVRSWRKLDKRIPKERRDLHPVVPEEPGHPVSNWKKRKTLWKRVPVNRDSDEREWVEFDRNTGESVSDLYYDSDEEVCPNCGVVHGMTDIDSDDSSF